MSQSWDWEKRWYHEKSSFVFSDTKDFFICKNRLLGKDERSKMKEKLTTKQYLLIGTMLFGMFFGAGNLILPPMVGKLAGNQTWFVMLFFNITAIILPVLGVVAVAKSDGLKNLASRVDERFAGIYTACIYLSIGPVLAIPRASGVAYEMGVKPYLPEFLSDRVALFLYTLVFFGIVYWLAITPSKLVQRLGKMITPVLIVLIVLLFATAIIHGMPKLGSALTEEYQMLPASTGFIEGYMTMDTIAALNFGIVISMVIREFGVSSESQIIKSTIKAGSFAGLLLAVIYFMLAYLGASSASLFTDTTNGAQILSKVSTHLLGQAGAILVGLIFTLACLSVSAGLITSSSKYFTSISQKLSYRGWVILWIGLSFLFANIGLDAILKYNVTILFVLYPIAIILIVLALLDKWVKSNHLLYRLTVYTAMVISAVGAIAGQLGYKIPVLYSLFSYLPFHKAKLEWVIPVLVMAGIALVLTHMGFGRKRA